MSDRKNKDSDLLDLEKLDSLPHPLVARILGGQEFEIQVVCVATGAMRIDVCGMHQCGQFSDVMALIDADGFEHDPDEFWSDYEESLEVSR